MALEHVHVAVRVAAALALVACGTQEANATSDADSDLIRATVAADGDFPATVRILKVMGASCTGTKIADDLILTAGHCVGTRSGAIQGEFAPGRTLELTVRTPHGPEFRSGVIEETVLHPRFVEACQIDDCSATPIEDRRDAPDVGVVRLASGLEDVAIAKVDLDEARLGDAVTVVGYGCREDDWEGTKKDGALRFFDAEIDVVRESYLTTRGPAAAGGGGGLCDGDGGGAVYRRGTDLVTGVNAARTVPSGGDLPVTNWHARVDAQSPWTVATWLGSLGATMSRPL